MHLNWYRSIVSIKNRILFIVSQCVKKQSQDLTCIEERLFGTQLTWRWSMNMLKMLWCWFQERFCTFTMLLVKGSSETGLFRHLSDQVFGDRNFRNTKSMGFIICLKILKIYFRFRKCSKKLRKSFFFRDNCIWTGIVKLSLLGTGYFSSAANVLTSSSKMWHVNKRNVLKLNQFASDQWIW